VDEWVGRSSFFRGNGALPLNFDPVRPMGHGVSQSVLGNATTINRVAPVSLFILLGKNWWEVRVQILPDTKLRRKLGQNLSCA
jgi:hypothetical protein